MSKIKVNRCYINEFITELQSDLDSCDVEGLKIWQAELRTELQKHDLRRLNLTDFQLVQKLERVLSDSIAVSAF